MKNTQRNGFWNYMYEYIKDYRKNIAIAMVFAVIVGSCVAIQPLIIKYIVDSGITNEALNNQQKLQTVGIFCGVYMLVSLGRISSWGIGLKFMLVALEGSLFNLRSKFFSHVQSMCMRFYDKTSAGEIYNCIMGSPISNIKLYMNQIIIGVPYQLVSFVISVSALLYYDWLLTLILVLTALTMAILNYFAKRKIKSASTEYIKAETDASRYLTDSLHGMDAVKIYSVEDDMMQKFQYYTTHMYEKAVKVSFLQSIEGMKPEFVQYLGTAVVYIVGAVSCIYRGVSIGVLYAFLTSMGNILAILNSLLLIGRQKSAAEAGLYKILDILETSTSTPEIENQEKRRSVEVEIESAKTKGKPCIAFENVDFSYDDKPIFENFSCTVQYGESVALVGGSGSGKSTFTKLAMRLYDPSGGCVRVHGRDVRQYGIHDLRVSFGVVPQNPFIFQGSIWDNVRIARPGASNKDIINAMEIAHVHEFVNDLPHGWNTMIGEGALSLSGGQKQRIAIARAVLGDPDILIFDEATSALDNISERHIQQAMETLMKTHTVIIVAHRLSTIRNVDRIMVFRDGAVVEEGSYDELIQKDGAFAELLTFKE